MEFLLLKIEEIDGKIVFFKLKKDNICFYDEFVKEIRENSSFSKQLNTIQTRIQEISDLKSLPQNKFKDVTPKREIVKEYEIKTPDLRIYLISDEKGKIIILGGKKSTQRKDYNKFRSLKKEYLNYIKTKK